MDESKLFVVAIDFGTTFSGFAFSTKDQPASIHKCDWKRNDLTSEKTPTSVLLDRDKKFVAFGYDAETKYLTNILPDEKTDNFYYFRRFKMMLYKERIDINATLKEENGKEMKALDVFKIAIDYLKTQAMTKLKTTLSKTKEDDVQYVITVPAIWEDQAKMFMREAAKEAGIVGSNLMIALEPEAASISCQELRTVREEKSFSATIKTGTKYVVVDLGGGTADITVHESRGEGLLEEILPPSGGPWGGTKVDEEYIRFLGLLFGQDVMKELKEDDLEDYTDLIYGFEVKKRSVSAKQKQSKGDDSSDKDIVITMPLGLMNTIKEKRGSIKSALENSPYKNSVTVSGQKLYFKPDVFRKLFEPTIELLISHLDVLLKKKELSGLNYIVLVGGFSECDLVQKAVKEKFGKKEKPAIIIPTEAGFAVLKGAVLYGHNPKQISKRILKKTYGIQSWPDFDPDIHPLSKKVRIQGEDRCKDVFYKFAEKGTKVESGHRKSQIFQVLKPDERTLELAVYISDDKSPKFVTDPTCQRLGKLVVPLPNLRHGESLEVEESLIFGDTELLFTARDLKTGRTFETQFNF